MLLRRVVAAPMWFVTTMMMYELVIYVTGGPHQLGPLLGVTTAFLVAVDPLHKIWPIRKADSPLKSFERRGVLPSPTHTA